MLRCGGGTTIAISSSPWARATPKRRWPGGCRTCERRSADLRARGVRIEEYEAPLPVTVDGVADMGHSWAAWFTDPSRNVLSVVQAKA